MKMWNVCTDNQEEKNTWSGNINDEDQKDYLPYTPRKFKDNEEFFSVDWNKAQCPAACLLDYDFEKTPSDGVYAIIYDTVSHETIARSRAYRNEEYATDAAEKLLGFLHHEFGFETDYQPGT